MARRRRPRMHSVYVEPDLPITPMLDMSFQLLAFFIITFNPSPLEGHLDMALPKMDGGANSEASPPPSLDVDGDDLVVTVEATAGGEIGQIRYRGKDETESRPLGADSAVLFATLKDRLKTRGSPGKVRLELPDNLSYKLVIKLIDEITRAGYKQVSPTLHGKK